MTKHQPAPTCDGPLPCNGLPTERNRYFTGKYMTARDFAAEQDYLIGRHRLHNRLLHGWGVVCGLEVEHHPSRACQDRWVIVKAGVAIDCCGRELVLAKDIPVKLPLPWAGSAPGETCRVYGEELPEETRHEPFLLCLRYEEESVELVPVLYGDRCLPGEREANRVREQTTFDTCDILPGCWNMPASANDDKGAPDCVDCADGGEGSTRSCLATDCPCGEAVPIALIDFSCDELEPKFSIDTSGRRLAGAQSGTRLTRIVRTNWVHGDEVPLRKLVGEWGGKLKVTFDRPLKEAPLTGTATGINPHTFIVQYAGLPRHLEFVPSCEDTPSIDPDDPCTAVFWIEPRSCLGLAGNVVHVTLRCDFILDCYGDPVDGNHLRGTLPTGDGVPGGVFESWFVVTFNGEADRPEPAAYRSAIEETS